MSGAFPPDYFGPDYFGPDYFGGESVTPTGNMSATLAGTSSLTATLSVADISNTAGGGGARKRKVVSTKPFKKPDLIKRLGLPEVYYAERKPSTDVNIRPLLQKPVAIAPGTELERLFKVTPAAQVDALQAAALAAADAQAKRNDEAIQALLVLIPLLELEQQDRNNEAAIALTITLSVAMEDI